MKVEVLKKGKKDFEIKITGESHTLLNLLHEELLKDKNVDFAAYTKPHPLVDYSVFYFRMKSGDPKKSLTEAIKRISSLATDFEKEFMKAKEGRKV